MVNEVVWVSISAFIVAKLLDSELSQECVF